MNAFYEYDIILFDVLGDNMSVVGLQLRSCEGGTVLSVSPSSRRCMRGWHGVASATATSPDTELHPLLVSPDILILAHIYTFWLACL